MFDTPDHLIEEMADEAFALIVHGVTAFEYQWYADMYGESHD